MGVVKEIRSEYEPPNLAFLGGHCCRETGVLHNVFGRSGNRRGEGAVWRVGKLYI